MSRLEHFHFTGVGADPEVAFARYRELYARALASVRAFRLLGAKIG